MSTTHFVDMFPTLPGPAFRRSEPMPPLTHQNDYKTRDCHLSTGLTTPQPGTAQTGEQTHTNQEGPVSTPQVKPQPKDKRTCGPLYQLNFTRLPLLTTPVPEPSITGTEPERVPSSAHNWCDPRPTHPHLHTTLLRLGWN